MATLTADKIARRLIDLSLVEQQELQEVLNRIGRNEATGQDLLEALQSHNLLTNWQVDRVLKDYRIGFFYGDYKILYLAGAGTFARVFRGMHRETGHIMAIKVLRARHADDDDVVAHFVREGEVGMKLRHPNIVHVESHGVEHHTHYIVMDFVEGEHLRKFVEIRKKLSPAEATSVMIDITNGVKYAHQQGYAHRDMKMTNVLMSTTGQAKLIDFGLAAKQGEEGVPRTVDYAGLEKAAGAPKDDPRTDLYFLGCMYYHMLMGEAPLRETKNRAERGARARFFNVVPIQHAGGDVPRVIGEIVDRAMHINPEIRYQTAPQLLIDLRRAADRLAKNETDPDESDSGGESQIVSAGPQHPVMIVETDPQMQDAFREGLKKSGYRVLITSDPFRALERFLETPGVAECLIVSAEGIGPEAVEAFNQFGEHEETKHIPAILLLGVEQREWRHQAQLEHHRVFMTLPIKLKALRAVLARLLSEKKDEDEEET